MDPEAAMGLAGARAVTVVIASKARSLLRLSVRENELEDKGAVLISKALVKVSATRVACVLSRMQHMRRLVCETSQRVRFQNIS
jgi:hypothetical protein